MKYIIAAILMVASISASAASTIPWPGGVTVAHNSTTNKVEMVPQCFPWTLRSSYLIGNISDMYENQKSCQIQRKIDFGI